MLASDFQFLLFLVLTKSDRWEVVTYSILDDKQLNQLILPGTTVNSIICRDVIDVDRLPRDLNKPSVLRLVDAGYRFFDLAVTEAGRQFYWSPFCTDNSCSEFPATSSDTCRRRQEVTRDLRLIASSASRLNGEMFVLRFSVESTNMDAINRSASTLRLLQIVFREFNFRLVRASLIGSVVGEMRRANGSNVVVFVRSLDGVLSSLHEQKGTTDAMLLQLREYFATDNIVSATLPLTSGNGDYISDDLCRQVRVQDQDQDQQTCSFLDVGDEVLARHRHVQSTLTQLIVRVPDDDVAIIGNGYSFRRKIRNFVSMWSHTCTAVLLLSIGIWISVRLVATCHSAGCQHKPRVTWSFSVKDASTSPGKASCRHQSDLIINLMPCILRGGKLYTLVLIVTVSGVLVASSALLSQTGSAKEYASSCPAEVIDAMWRWAARPGVYRLNIVTIVGRLCTSSRRSDGSRPLTELASFTNDGRLSRQVSLVHAGSPLTGTVGFRSMFVCRPVDFAYAVSSREEGRVVTWNQLTEGQSRDFSEADYPMDSNVVVYVATAWNTWLQIYSANLQSLIESGRDVYIRGTESRSGVGLAYVTNRRHHVTTSCRSLPTSGLINSTRWNGQHYIHQQQQQQQQQEADMSVVP